LQHIVSCVTPWADPQIDPQILPEAKVTTEGEVLSTAR
jgi:hypothetical protein